MTHLAPWQRVTYYCGEALMIGGLLWALYTQFVLHACPVGLPGLFQPFSLVVAGIALDTLPLHPFGASRYLRPGLRRSAIGAIWWVLALAGVGFALYAVVAAAAPVSWWLLALVPAFLWYWTAVRSRSDGQPALPKQALPAPPRKEAAASNDDEKMQEEELGQRQ
jgi:hypothetical protein